MKQLRYLRNYSPPIGILVLAILGARFYNNLYIYIMIIGICTIVGLIAFDKVKERFYPIYIFSISLALLYQSTLISNGLIGTDIHTEYYFYQRALDGWDITIPHAYNSAIGTTIIAPFLTNYLHIPGYYVFKAVFPLLFAFVPLILYYIFKNQFGNKIAFLSIFFFVAIPTYTLEMIGLPRQMLAELMFVLCLFFITVSKLKMRFKIPLLIMCSILGAMFHYVIGPAIILYFGLSCLFLLFFKRRTLPIKWLGIVTGILLLTTIAYYGVVAQGVPLDSILGTSSKQIGGITQLIPKPTPPQPPPPITPPTTLMPAAPKVGYFMGQEPLMRTALGLDFIQASLVGKIFRILQYITEICIILGCILLIKNRKKYKAEYLSLCGVSIFLLACCVFLPKFSNILNATRFYHLALFLLAPALVIGGLLIFRNIKVFTLCILLPYFLFTSGFIFEATQQTNIQTINIPYSIPLSGQRVNITSIFTKNDMEVRDWAVNNIDYIYADINGCLLFSEKVEMDWSVNWRCLHYALVQSKGFAYGPPYIFLSERNMQTKTLTFKPMTGESATGERQTYTFKELGFDLNKCTILYQEGGAMIVRYNS